MKNLKLLLKCIFVLSLIFSITAFSPVNQGTVMAAASAKKPYVKQNKITLIVGSDTYQIKLLNLTKDAKVNYKSSDKKVAAISSSGKITPKNEGTAKVIAVITQNNKKYNTSAYVTVKKPYVGFTASTNYMNIKEAYAFHAKGYGIDDDIKWSVSDRNIAIITSDGKLTALATGSAIVYAQAGDNKAECKVEIGSNRIGTFSKDVSFYKNKSIWITVSDKMQDETIKAEVNDSKIFTYKWGRTIDNKSELILIPKKTSTGTLTLSSSKTNDKLTIHVTVIKKPQQLKKLTATKIYDKCGPSTVEIKVTVDYGTVQGSGFFIDKGMVVTNYHVIKGASKIQVTTKENVTYDVQKIIGYDEKLDLAVLQIAAEKNKSLSLYEGEVSVGEESYALGSPLGLTGTMTSGMISSASRYLDDVPDVNYIQTSAPLSHGNSGGPLVNSYGEVVGINTLCYEAGQNLNFAINIKELQKVNTNNQQTVAEYYSIYENELNKKFIKEDPQRSQYTDNCQSLSADSGVEGTLTKDEKGDYYKFTVKEAGYYEIDCISSNDADFDNTFLQLYDSTKENVASSYVSKSYENKQYIYMKLTPGDYYINVTPDKDYTGDDMPYVVYVSNDD